MTVNSNGVESRFIRSSSRPPTNGGGENVTGWQDVLRGLFPANSKMPTLDGVGIRVYANGAALDEYSALVDAADPSIVSCWIASTKDTVFLVCIPLIH